MGLSASGAPSSRHVGHAGESAAARFQQERLKNLKSEWKGWLGIAGFGPASIAFMVFWGKAGLIVGGWMLGFVTALCLFGWMVGFDVRSLPWLWGSWGEEDTKKELERLSGDWYVRHDIANPYGNWDHVAVGPPGVFLIDSKRLNGSPIKIQGDGLSSGRLRLRGTTFRGSAVGLKKALARHVAGLPDVQAVVAVWGNFAAEPKENERVVYLNATGLVDWLGRRDTTLDPTQRAALIAAVEAL